MGKDAKNWKPLGFWGNFGVGCLLDIVLMAGFACVVKTDTLAGALAYATVLAVVTWGVRWLLKQFDLLDGWCGRLIGPVVLVGAMLLAVFCPIKTDKADSGPNGSSSIVEQAPSGVRYTPASTNVVGHAGLFGESGACWVSIATPQRKERCSPPFAFWS